MRETLLRTARRLEAAGIDSARLDARVLFEHAASDPARFEGYIARRERREPVAYITGTKGFWTLDLDIGPGALVPRPETETLIEEALRQFPDRTAPLRALDFGVGSGAILLSFLSEYPNASGAGIDRACGWAKRNAVKLGLMDRVQLLEADWSEMPDETCDLVFSNPPYLTSAQAAAPPPELGFEPRAALDGGADGLVAYRSLAPLIASRLNKSGFCFLEIGQGQAADVTGILAAHGLETIRVVADLSRIPRVIVAQPQKTLGMGRASR